MHSSGPLSIIHAEQDKIWVDSCAGVHPGDEVSQTSFTSDLCDLFHAFESFWSSLWNKHASVPDSQWDDIIGFAATQLRPMAPSQPAFTTCSRPTLSVVVCCAKRSSPPLDLMEWVMLICWPFRTLIWVCLSGLLILRAVLALGPSRP